jgi:hypothetical protein
MPTSARHDAAADMAVPEAAPRHHSGERRINRPGDAYQYFVQFAPEGVQTVT